jgi:putative tricarboxylic transport membrane protein
MNSDANPILTLAWTFGVMSLFAVGGANAAIPEMHRLAVDVQHWMTDKQFADVFAISQLSPGPNVLIVTLIGYSVAGVAGALVATPRDARFDRCPCLLCEPSSDAIEPFALACDYSGGTGPAFNRVDGRQRPDPGADRRSDLGWRPGHRRRRGAGLCHAAQSALAVAGRGLFGFCWRYLTKIARQCPRESISHIRTENGREALRRGERSMSETPSRGPVKYIMPKWIRGPQDFVGGLALIAIALFALWASSDLQGMHGFSFGAGTAPRMFAVLLLGLGIAVMVVGLVTDGEHITTYAWRGPLFVSLAILSFAITIRPLGLVVSAFASFIISALGTPEMKWKETIIVGICLTIGCSLLFPYALGLPLQLFPRFLVQ